MEAFYQWFYLNSIDKKMLVDTFMKQSDIPLLINAHDKTERISRYYIPKPTRVLHLNYNTTRSNPQQNIQFSMIFQTIFSTKFNGL